MAAINVAGVQVLQSLALSNEELALHGERSLSKPPLSQAWSERCLQACYGALCCVLRKAAEISGQNEFQG